MTPPVFAHIAWKLRHLGVQEIGLFYMGESFLCGWLPQAICYAKAAGFSRVFITTNGVSALPARVSECIRAGLDSLKFALNWADAAQFEEMTGGARSTYGQVLANIAAARSVRDEIEREGGHRCRLSASSIRYDDAQPARMEPALAEVRRFVDEHYWLPLYGGPDSACGTLRGTRKPIPCPALFNELHVTADGHISACSLDASPRFHVSNIASGSLACAWLSSPFRALRQAHLDGDLRNTVCTDCTAYRQTTCQ